MLASDILKKHISQPIRRQQVPPKRLYPYTKLHDVALNTPDILILTTVTCILTTGRHFGIATAAVAHLQFYAATGKMQLRNK